MGKIFDALEKANKQQTIRPISMRADEKVQNKVLEEDKVVPFANNNNKQQASDTLSLDKTLVAYHAPQSIEADMFKSLKTNILFPAKGTPAKSILVTSAVPGDGKSFVSSNFAISVAQGIEQHVLLIDCDIRRPTIHSLFGVPQNKGLSDFLTSGSDLAQHLCKTSVEKLTILPGGKPPMNPTELLTASKMKNLLNEVKARYDDRYIILDSPPPVMAPETTAIAKHVDGVLLVVRAGKTPKRAVTEVIEQIGKEKIIGIVLNHCEESVKRYHGYGKSYYQRD